MLQQAWSTVMDVCDGVTVWPCDQPDKLLRDLQAHTIISFHFI
jgi:hypothetical protein